MQQEILEKAKKELTALRIELIKSKDQILPMKVESRDSGVKLQNKDGKLIPVGSSNPTAEIVVFRNGLFTIGGKEFDFKDRKSIF